MSSRPPANKWKGEGAFHPPLESRGSLALFCKQMLRVFAAVTRQHRLSHLVRHMGKADQADFCHGDHLHLPWLHHSYQDLTLRTGRGPAGSQATHVPTDYVDA